MSFLPLLGPIARLCMGIILKFDISRAKGHALIYLIFPFYFTHNITQFTKFPQNYYFYLVKEFSRFIIN